jgi:hypothetical protein
MKIIKKGIVFSNDIQRILEGYNAINFSYNNQGIIIPNKNFIESLRKDFTTTVNKIFTQTTTIQESEMLESIYTSISPFLGRYPHCISR